MSEATDGLGDRLSRWTGLAGIVGGVALALAYWAHPPAAPPATVASTAWVLIHVAFMVSLLTGVFLLFALLARFLRHGGGALGVLGCVLGVLSLVFVFGLDYAEVFIFPVLAVEYPQVVLEYGDGTMMPSIAFAFPITGLLFVLGFVLFSWQLMRTGAVDPMAAVTTLVGTLVFGLGLSGLLPMIVVRIGATVFGAGLILLGLALWRPRKDTT